MPADIDESLDEPDESGAASLPPPRPMSSLVATALPPPEPRLQKAGERQHVRSLGEPDAPTGRRHALEPSDGPARFLQRRRLVGMVTVALVLALALLVAGAVVRLSADPAADAQQPDPFSLLPMSRTAEEQQAKAFCSWLDSNPGAYGQTDMRNAAHLLCDAYRSGGTTSKAAERRERYLKALKANGLLGQFSNEQMAYSFARATCRTPDEPPPSPSPLTALAAVAAYCPDRLALLDPVQTKTPVAAGAPSRSTVALWRMNEGPDATLAIDGSRRQIDATVGALVDTGQRRGHLVSYGFDVPRPRAVPATHDRLVSARDTSWLDPVRDDYSVTIRYRSMSPSGNLVQKGQALTPGGFWKIAQSGGLAQCYWKGSQGQATVTSGRRLDDGLWHVVTCERSGGDLTMTVDGVVSGVNHQATGRVSNAMPLTIGGKWACNQRKVHCNYFDGDIDYVRIDSKARAG